MTTWDDQRLWCIHGIREELDYHDCPKCKDRAISNGKDYHFPDRTFIYTTEETIEE